jgi:predicted DNA-binding transcriptional regulator
MSNTNLWRATQQPSMVIEDQLRALRLWEYLEQKNQPVIYKDIRRDMGLTYRQTVRTVGVLCAAGVVKVTVTADWNGCHYVYPHQVWLTTPVL